MNTRDFTCIVCPNGCEITAAYSSSDYSDLRLTGNLCKRGEEYVRQELISPMRTIASSVKVTGGRLPLASVRLTRPVPKDRIFDVMAEIQSITVSAPVESGSLLRKNILGLDSDLIITKSIPAE